MFVAGQSGNPKGKPKGAISLRTRAIQEMIDSATVKPHEFLLAVLQGKKLPKVGKDGEDYIPTFSDRRHAATELMPYYLPKLKSIEVTGEIDGELTLKVVKRVVIDGEDSTSSPSQTHIEA